MSLSYNYTYIPTNETHRLTVWLIKFSKQKCIYLDLIPTIKVVHHSLGKDITQ